MCNECNTLLFQDALPDRTRLGIDSIVLRDRIPEFIRKGRKIRIDIIAAVFFRIAIINDIVRTSCAVVCRNQCIRLTIDSYRGFAIAIRQASDGCCIFKSLLDAIYVAINLLETISRDSQVSLVNIDFSCIAKYQSVITIRGRCICRIDCIAFCTSISRAVNTILLDNGIRRIR